MSGSPLQGASSPYLVFGRKEWGELRADTPLLLTEQDLDQLRGINENVSMAEVREAYLPLSRLLNLYVGATQSLYDATAEFFGKREEKVPYIIAVAGSVAVGKSTTARILQALLKRFPSHSRVDLVTTDGFLWPNEILEERGLMNRKGFPESYDVRRLTEFVARVKSGERGATYPIYSHQSYDIIPDKFGVIDQPDIMIIEGLNVLQPPPVRGNPSEPRRYLSDLFDFSIYVDAPTSTIERWYQERFLTFRDTAFRNPGAYFHRYASLSENEAKKTANGIWKEINEVNLVENILGTRERAHLILTKAPDHSIEQIRLRRL